MSDETFQPTRRDVFLSRLIDRFILRFASGPTRRLFRRALLDAAQREWGLSLHRSGYVRTVATVQRDILAGALGMRR